MHNLLIPTRIILSKYISILVFALYLIVVEKFQIHDNITPQLCFSKLLGFF